MGKFFKGEHPNFGRTNARLSANHLEKSHYYWWWEFLRRNEAYIRCCEQGGTGELAALYKDFGDVVNVEFKDWWLSNSRGFRLFSEKQKVDLKVLHVDSDWDVDCSSNQFLVTAVNLETPKRFLIQAFTKQLNKVHKGTRGRVPLSTEGISSARYPLHRSASPPTLKIQLQIYDLVMAKKRGEIKISFADIGKKFNFASKSQFKDGKEVNDPTSLRAVWASMAQRYFKDASNIIANTSNGRFPDSKPVSDENEVERKLNRRSR